MYDDSKPQKNQKRQTSKILFSLEAARWEDAAKSPNARKLYEYYCYKRQFDLYNKTNPWVVVSNVGLWEM